MTTRPQISLLSHSRRKLLATAVIPGLVLAGCAPEEKTASPQTTTMTASSASRSTETVTETSEPSDKDVQASLGSADFTEPTETQAAGKSDLAISNLRVGHHNGFDRVVIEFSGTGTPGWFAEYSDDPRQQGSGYPVDINGDTAINLLVRGASMDLTSIYPVGPVAGISPTGAITGVNHQGVFEGNAQFVIGVKGPQRPYTVSVLQGPPRVVVDIQE